MSNNSNIAEIIIETINTIFETLFSSIDNSLYSVLDNITFISPYILNDKYFEKIFGTSTSNGILLIANSLLIAFVLYFGARFLLSHFTYSPIETPYQFILKMLIFGVCMNFSYFLVEQFILIMSSISSSILNLGHDLFGKDISFSNLISLINTKMSYNTSSLNIFSIDGLIKGTLSLSLFNLVFSYSLRYIIIKIFVLLAPFAFLSLSLQSTSWFFKAWIRNFFSLLFVQIIVALVLIVLFSMDFSSGNIVIKFIYVGGIYALIRVNSFVKEFVGGISTEIQSNLTNFSSFIKH